MLLNIFKYTITKIIHLEAKLILWRHKPRIIAIAGTVGKTSTKDVVFQAISKKLIVRKTLKSLNSELGVPLTIIGKKTGWKNPLSWLSIVWSGFWQIIYNPNYPDWLVIETGVDHPGDMEKIAKLLRPEIVVITAFGKVPAHVEFFNSPEDVMKEKSKLINYIKKDGALILNADDQDVLKLKTKSVVKTYTYGIENEDADIRATNSDMIYPGPTGISFKINHEGNVIPIILKNVLGDQYIYPVLSAMIISKILDISQTDAAEMINKFVPAPGRMNIIKGKNKSIIIDDTYNASPIAVKKALSTLDIVNCEGNKIAILGDMLEIGRFSHSEHEKIGEIVASLKLDYLVTVGIRAEDIGKIANENGMAKKRIFILKDYKEAQKVMKKLILEKEGSVILAKGSQGVRLEKVVKEMIVDKESSDKLLVRQEKEWLMR